MNSTMRIKRHLPPAPEPTRERKDPRRHSSGLPMRKLSPVKGFNDEAVRERVKATCKKRQEVAKHRREIVARMVTAGNTDVEIMEATGYSLSSVRRIASMMRNEGIDIPQRQKGRKK